MRTTSRWREWLSICADILQVTTFFGLTVAAIVSIFVMLIGWLTEVPLFWIAVGTPVAALATLLTLNRFKKPTESPAGSIGVARDQFKKELEYKAKLNRQQLFRGPTAKPSYALPPEAERIQIGSLSFQDLGDMVIQLAKEIRAFLNKVQLQAQLGSYPDHRIVNEFVTLFAPRLFGLYQEARNRGLQNDVFDGLHANLQRTIFNGGHVRNVAIELDRFGHDVRVRSY